MKKWLGVGLAVLVLAVPVRAEEVPQVEARAAVVMEAVTGRVVFAQNAEEPLPMASTTKLMTTLLALEQEGLDEPFTVDSEAIRVEGSSMGLREGDTVTLRTLCYGMMLASGNDAANAAAVRCAGSLEAFVEQMNTRAAALEMENTHFATPSGLDGEGHQSTARDMALLMRAALESPDFCAIAGAKTARLEYGNPPYARTLTNHNKLLWSCEGVVAGKTGFTRAAGRCLVSAARRQDITLICVTLGCPDDWNTHARLYDHCFARLEPVALSELAGGLSLPAVGTGRRVGAVPDENIALPLSTEERQLVTLEAQLPAFVYPPVEAGQPLGRLRVLLGEQELCSCTLVAKQKVQLAFQPRTTPQSLWQWLRERWG